MYYLLKLSRCLFFWFIYLWHQERRSKILASLPVCKQRTKWRLVPFLSVCPIFFPYQLDQEVVKGIYNSGRLKQKEFGDRVQMYCLPAKKKIDKNQKGKFSEEPSENEKKNGGKNQEISKTIQRIYTSSPISVHSNRCHS